MNSTLLSLLDRLRGFNARNARHKGAARPRVQKRQKPPVLETLEDRTLLSTISGKIVEDLTANGITPDDLPLAGWTVQLTRQEESTLLSADFSDGAGASSLDGFSATGLWHATTACPGPDAGRATPEAALFGVDWSCGLYPDLGISDLTSAALNLPTNGISAVGFVYRLGDADGTLAGVASLEVSVDSGGFAAIASNTQGNLSVSNSWANFWIDVSEYAGRTIVMRFRFQPSLDATGADFGWQVDDVKVTYRYSVEVATDSQGNYSLLNVGPGTYDLTAFGPYGWRETVATAATVTVTDNNQTFTGYDVGEFEMGRISGQVFSDDNGNGLKDPQEIGLNGFIIELRGGNGELVTTTTTGEVDVDGNGMIDPTTEAGIYEFAGVAAGTYNVVMQLGNGWTQTSANPSSTSFSGTNSGQSVGGQTFGAQCPVGMTCAPPTTNPPTTNPPTTNPPTTNPPTTNPPTTSEICGDGVDNDGDGLIDEGCTMPPPPPPETCGDGIDNDGDGLIDEGCPTPPPPPTETCGNGIDDDSDGLIDEGCPTPPPPPPCTPQVAINDTGGPVPGLVSTNPQNRTKSVVGAGHTLTVHVIQSCGSFVNSASWNVNWGVVAKNYLKEEDPGRDPLSEGRVVPLELSDLNKTGAAAMDPLHFYWLHNARGDQTVTVDVTFHLIPGTVHADGYFNVQAPITGPDFFTSVTRSVNTALGLHQGQRAQVVAFQEFRPTHPRYLNGIRWRAEVTNPVDFGGAWHFTQLIKPNRKFFKGLTLKYEKIGPSWLASDWDRYQLDTRFRYNAPIVTVDPDGIPAEDPPEEFVCEGSKGPNMRLVIECVDSPSEILDRFHNPRQHRPNRFEVSERYRLFLMYTPAVSDAIPVTIGRLEWFWSAKVEKANNRWNLRQSDWWRNPRGTLYYDQPRWTGVCVSEDAPDCPYRRNF